MGRATGQRAGRLAARRAFRPNMPGAESVAIQFARGGLRGARGGLPHRSRTTRDWSGDRRCRVPGRDPARGTRDGRRGGGPSAGTPSRSPLSPEPPLGTGSGADGGLQLRGGVPASRPDTGVVERGLHRKGCRSNDDTRGVERRTSGGAFSVSLPMNLAEIIDRAGGHGNRGDERRKVEKIARLRASYTPVRLAS